MKRIVFFLVIFAAVQITAFADEGEGPAAPWTIRLQPFMSGFTSPVFMTHAGDGSNRLFVVEQGGIIRVIQPGTRTVTEFLNISTRVSCCGERGLLGLVFHPQYETNRRFFVYYTRASDGAIEIAEYAASAGNPNVADTTERVILTIPHPIASNHNGGTIAFGPDGYLYAAPGDGGGANDPFENGQNINALLGKVLRIDIDPPFTTPADSPAYSIPPTNPYAGATPGADEIYAIGLRNPYRFSFDRDGTNQLWLGDVGQGSKEEVDIITRGGNYGWRTMEGTICTPGLNGGVCTPPPGHIPPVFEYSSASPSVRCSITGGYVYRGLQRHLPQGSYIYGDYCTGEILIWNNNQQQLLLDTGDFQLVSFAEDEYGEIYRIGHHGVIEKIVRARSSADVNGDLRSDVTVFRPTNGTWYALLNASTGSVLQQEFGADGDIPTPGDIDTDNVTDIGYFRPSDGSWSFLRSGSGTVVSLAWGVPGDLPTPADYDGDAFTDVAIFRPSEGAWYVLRSSDEGFDHVYLGQAGDHPVPGDYDGDGRDDIAVFRGSEGRWYRQNSSDGAIVVTHWGLSGDQPATGDFDGDGRIDHAVFRPSDGIWYIRFATGAIQGFQWGLNNDIPAVGDYDGDGRDDIAVFRPSDGTWYVNRSTEGFHGVQWGTSGDVPVLANHSP
jgi:glucose/arabinose dehydrogenase